MSVYEIIFILTTPLCTISIYLLNHVFFNENKHSKTVEIVAYILYTILLSIIFIWIRVPIAFLLLNLICFFIISLNYYSSILKRVLNVFIVYTILFAIEIIIWGLIGFFELNMFQYNQFDSIIGVLLVRLLSISISYIVYKYAKNNAETITVPAYYYILYIGLIIGIMWMFLFSLENEKLTMWYILISSGVLVIVIISIILINEIAYKSFQAKFEMAILKQQNESYENQAEIIKQSIQSIRSVKHDINNHIASIISIYENNSPSVAKEYVTQIINDINNKNDIINSGNFIVDSILNFKLSKLLKTDTELSINVKIPERMDIAAYDITGILGNLLDNAIAAIEKCTDNKKLFLDISIRKQNLVILIDNSYNGELTIKNGSFVSLKQDKDNHGLGIKNVEKILLKYGGSLQIEHTETIFSVSVLIPFE